MDMSATGEPVMTHADPQVRVGVHIEQGTCVLTQGGTDFAAFHAWVEFAAPDQEPWTAVKVEFSAKRSDGGSVGLTVDLLNDACDGPRGDVPNAIWKVVALAATSAGDVGIRYTAPTSWHAVRPGAAPSMTTPPQVSLGPGNGSNPGEAEWRGAERAG